jgi:hypothetical protein
VTSTIGTIRRMGDDLSILTTLLPIHVTLHE